MATPTIADAMQSKRAMGGLATLSAAQFLIALDFSVIFVALPSMGSDLRLSESAMQWVVSAYAVFFAGFLVVGGRVADRLGARNMFVAALLLFGIASLVGGFAGEASLLLVARAAQGVAAATMQPAILALVNTTFPAGAARTRALAVWGTVGASGLAAGVVIGGLLTTVSWRWTFFVNLPFALVCMLAAPKVLPRAREGRAVVRLNVLSAVLCTGTVLSTTLGLTMAADSGWGHPVTLVSFAVAAVFLVLFVLRERSSAQPLVEPALRTTRTLLAGCGSSALYMASVAATEFYLVTLLLQQQRGFGPLEAGIAFLPLPVCITLGNMIAGRLIGPLGVRRTLTLAFLIGATGLALLGLQINADGYVAGMLPGLVVSGIGHGMTYTSMFVGGTRDVADDNQGVAGALMTTTQYAGGALGVACLVLVLGPAPDLDRFMMGFLLAAVVAVAGAVLAWTGFSRAGDTQVQAEGNLADAQVTATTVKGEA
ncbi:MFS transporter [Streptomyces meridianus]|uniref:MFS transporter n=1 Tax=Streptomyces meridianus TaxID=2938945 RepID=A0ABT0X9W8_9ACTN|nr:MFS transporter [Streptomyces meridianus]MCM2578584.1 MFS transporter [Streptomyces meridianus]